MTTLRPDKNEIWTVIAASLGEAAFLVELFPAKIRYTSMSLPYHIGNGVFGGLVPLIGTYYVAKTGNLYAGLYYPITVALVTFIAGSIFIKETKKV